MKRPSTILVILLMLSSPVLAPSILAGLPVPEHYIEEYQLRTLHSYTGDSIESVSGWGAFREKESFYLTCLK